MQALTYWKTVTMDQSNFLEQIIAFLNQHRIQYCVIGGQGVNAYVEPVVSLDLDIVILADQLEQVETLLQASSFRMQRFPHSLNLTLPGSDVRVQVQTDPVYASFPERAVERDLLGLRLPVAALTDVLSGKIWAAQDSTRRPSKRQKDLADIARLLEAYPELGSQVPQDILDRLL